MTEIKKGDRVKVTVEGVVTRETMQDFLIGDERHGRNAIFAKRPDDYTVTVEKIEPPVETFKPGDVIRSRTDPDTVLALGDRTYTYVGRGNRGVTVKRGATAGWSDSQLNSREFEKVTLS